MKNLLLALVLLPMSAFASIGDDLAIIRPLLPAGSDVAQIQAIMLKGNSQQEAEDAGKSNYLIRDINGDGINDILVISEVNPRLEKYTDNQPCSDVNEPECSVVYGDRSLRLFTGNRDGSFTLAFENTKMMLNGDEGGTFGDPLNGFVVRKNGSIEYSVYGGSSWRWSYTDVLSFRKGNLYVIGQDEYNGWTGDGRALTKSVNLLTGDVIETSQKDGDAPVKTKRSKIAVKPLVKVADYMGQSND